MTLKLLIARHGNTFSPGEQVTRVGITDLPLAESGLKQGQVLGAYLKKHKLIPDLIFTSKLKRTIQTAEQVQAIMESNIPIEPLSIFNEIDYGPDENQPESHVLARIGQQALNDWEAQAFVPHGWKVNPAHIINNWMAFAEKLRKEQANKTCLVITSNGIARFAPYLTGDFAAFSAQHKIKIATGALCIFEDHLHDKGWNCSAWNLNPSSI